MRLPDAARAIASLDRFANLGVQQDHCPTVRLCENLLAQYLDLPGCAGSEPDLRIALFHWSVLARQKPVAISNGVARDWPTDPRVDPGKVVRSIGLFDPAIASDDERKCLPMCIDVTPRHRSLAYAKLFGETDYLGKVGLSALQIGADARRWHQQTSGEPVGLCLHFSCPICFAGILGAQVGVRASELQALVRPVGTHEEVAQFVPDEKRRRRGDVPSATTIEPHALS